jgi:hypothetical protein
MDPPVTVMVTVEVEAGVPTFATPFVLLRFVVVPHPELARSNAATSARAADGNHARLIP